MDTIMYFLQGTWESYAPFFIFFVAVIILVMLICLIFFKTS